MRTALRLLWSATLGEKMTYIFKIFIIFLAFVRVESGFVLLTNAQRSIAKI